MLIDTSSLILLRETYTFILFSIQELTLPSLKLFKHFLGSGYKNCKAHGVDMYLLMFRCAKSPSRRRDVSQ